MGLHLLDAELRALAETDSPTNNHLEQCADCQNRLNALLNQEVVPRSLRRCDAGQLPSDEGGWPSTTSRPIAADPAPASCGPEPQPESSWPRKIGRYDVLGKLGEGGMGTVYLARDPQLGRLVAVKRSLGHLSGPEYEDRLRREAAALAQVQHPQIVQVYEVGEHDGLPFVALEYCPGTDLARYLRRQPVPPTEAAHLVRQVAMAVNAAHKKKIIHRDLKPANVLLTFPPGQETEFSEGGFHRREDGPPLSEFQPKVTDFGLAKLVDVATRTEAGVVVGTPSYMAPEQARGDEVGPAADIYAVGAILYECLTGRPPFLAPTPAEVLRQVLRDEPVPVRRLQATVPADLETICHKCLQKEPGKRYASALELAEDLARFLAGEPIQARPPTRRERARRWAKRLPLKAQLGAAAAVALLVASALFAPLHYLRVRWERDQALVDAERERLEKDEAQQQHQRELRRIAALLRIDKGQQAINALKWRDAESALGEAWSIVQNDKALVDLEPRLRQLLRQAREELDSQADRVKSLGRYHAFQKAYSDALFYESLVTGLDGIEANRENTRKAAHAALELFSADPASATAPSFDDPYLSSQQRDEARTGCYELLLLSAQIEGDRPPSHPGEQKHGRLRRALNILQLAARIKPVTRSYHALQARYLRQLGDGFAAGKAAEQASRLTAGALDHFLLGKDAYRDGRFPQAIREFEKTLSLQPDHFWGQYYLAICRLQTEKFGEARALLTGCLGRRPDLHWVCLLRGFAHCQALDFEGAEADFHKVAVALRRQPDDSLLYGLYLHRGVLRLRQGRQEEAIADLREATRLRPKQYQGYLNLAQALSALGPGGLVVPTGPWQAWPPLALALVRHQRLDEAVRLLDEAIGLEGGKAPLYRARAYLLLKRGDQTAALADFEAAIRLDPAGAADHLERGRLLLQAGRPADSVASCDAALLARPDSPDAHQLRGEALFHLARKTADPSERLGHLAEAARSLGLYAPLKARPAAEVYVLRGLLKAQLKDYEGAVLDYTRALDLQISAGTHARRGWALVALGSPQLALRDFREATRLDPGNAEALIGRGRVHAVLRQYREAMDDANEALRQGPESHLIALGAACIFAQVTGGVGEARSGLRQAQTRADCQARALALLRSALSLQHPGQREEFWRTYVRPEPSLAPLRATPEYTRLDRDYGGLAR